MKYNKYEKEVVESTKFKVGDRVRIKGDASDFTDKLDGRMGTVVQVFDEDCIVAVDGSNNLLGGWFIYNYNMTLVKDDA